MLSTPTPSSTDTGKAFATDHLADLVADVLDRFDRPLEFGKLHLQVGPQLRQPAIQKESGAASATTTSRSTPGRA